MKRFLLALPLLLVACTPADQNYCARMNIPAQNVEYGNCIAYFHKMDNWFRSDFAQCNAQASLTYPDYLYDRPHYERATFIDRHGYPRSQMLLTEPDYYRDQAVTNLRYRIITPCMQSKGWNTARSWEDERQETKRKKH